MLTGNDFDLTCYTAVRDEALEMFNALDAVYASDSSTRADDFAAIWNKYL